jgi:hypothetical protein
MKDWKLVAAGHGLAIPGEELARVSTVLSALEDAFRPLAGTIPLETEPAVIFACPPEEQP